MIDWVVSRHKLLHLTWKTLPRPSDCQRQVCVISLLNASIHYNQFIGDMSVIIFMNVFVALTSQNICSEKTQTQTRALVHSWDCQHKDCIMWCVIYNIWSTFWSLYGLMFGFLQGETEISASLLDIYSSWLKWVFLSWWQK